MPEIVPVTDGRADQDIEQAVRFLKAGGVVAFPTDTLYGLGADVFSGPALERLFTIKGRSAALALPVLVSSMEQARMVARFTVIGRRLAERFWPGPLTLVLPKLDHLSGLVTGGRDTVAVRMPDHTVPLALTQQLRGPVTGTSANLSGGPDLHSLDALQTQLGDQVDYITRTGPPPQGTASTVVDVTGDCPQLIREGAISLDSVLAALK